MARIDVCFLLITKWNHSLKISYEGDLGRYSKAQFLQTTPKIDKFITKDLLLAMTTSYFGQFW